VPIPATIRAGDTVTWQQGPTSAPLHQSIDSSSWTLTYYLRTSATEGATVVGVPEGQGWVLTIAAATTARFTPGQWYWQAVATLSGDAVTIGTGQLQVLPSLSYTGQPGSFDGRSQVAKDLEAVQAAIRSIVAGGGVQQYSIGNRQLSRYRLSELLELESRLKAQLKREEAAELMANGLGNPGSLYVRF
jgi:hypothetical protein